MKVRHDIETTWTDDLSDQQRERLRSLQDRKCRFEAAVVSAAPQDHQAEQFLLEVFLDNYAVVRERGERMGEVFDRAADKTGTLLKFGTAGNLEESGT